MAKPVLNYTGKLPPLAVVAAAQLCSIDIDLKEDVLSTGSSYVTLVLPSGCVHRHHACLRHCCSVFVDTLPCMLYREQLQGIGSVLRYIGRTAEVQVYGTNAIEACMVRVCVWDAPSVPCVWLQYTTTHTNAPRLMSGLIAPHPCLFKEAPLRLHVLH